jgi:hypothetical protein
MTATFNEILFRFDTLADRDAIAQCLRDVGSKATLIAADGRTYQGFIEVREVHTPLTIGELKQEALTEAREWLEAHDHALCTADSPLDCQRQNIESSVRDLVPCMTTTLFNLVVQDNELGFTEALLESAEPFAVLSSAVERELVEHVFSTLEAEQEEADA